MNSETINSTEYQIKLGDYSLIDFEKLFLKEINKKRKFYFLVDENTKKHCLPLILKRNKLFENAGNIEILSGEKNKNPGTLNYIWEQLAEKKAERSSILVNLGGGVLSDIGGFAASTFKRGIDFVNIPTSLLSMVDATTGGKTGIDINKLKNLVGLFSNPLGVFIYPDFLNTLDDENILAGFAEMLKHGLIADKNYFNLLKSVELNNVESLKEKIAPSIIIKNNICTNDPFEKGERKKLNFGHTIGHAMESFSLKNNDKHLLHGEAVAIGMICEAYISAQLTGLSENELSEITEYILSVFSVYNFNKDNIPEILNIIYHDKKNRAGNFNFTLLNSIGDAVIDKKCEMPIIEDSINFYLEKTRK